MVRSAHLRAGISIGRCDIAYIKTRDLRDGAVTAAKMANGTITASQIASSAVTEGKLATDSVTPNKIMAGAVGMSKLSSSVAAEQVVTITNTEFLALRATPKTIISAPGANQLIVVERVILDITPSGGAYTETADNLQLKYINGSGVACSGAIETTGVIDGVGRATSLAYGTAAAGAVATMANAAVVLHNTGDGEFGGGNAANLIRCIVRYHVVSL